jgi:hypothetical protein
LAKISKLSYPSLKSIVGGFNHKWLGTLFPEEYATLMSLKGGRSRTSGRTLADKIGTIPNVISPEGEIYPVPNIAKFAREHNLNNAHLGAVLRGKEAQHKGWKLKQ